MLDQLKREAKKRSRLRNLLAPLGPLAIRARRLHGEDLPPQSLWTVDLETMQQGGQDIVYLRAVYPTSLAWLSWIVVDEQAILSVVGIVGMYGLYFYGAQLRARSRFAG